ncbi:MAG: hypothetical protein DMG21_14855 [Acidobacteria bacterium]|nr:MAG: hypothetical protein DMG21_14855 [Acidobacteriota bacterium]
MGIRWSGKFSRTWTSFACQWRSASIAGAANPRTSAWTWSGQPPTSRSTRCSSPSAWSWIRPAACSSTTTRRALPWRWRAAGDQLEQQQAYLEAVTQYQKVLELNKNSSLAHYRLGEIYFKLRNYNAAIEEMRRALDGDLLPKWIEVWAHLTIGKVFDMTGQRDRALNEYQLALHTNNNAQGALDEANKYIQHPYSEQAATAGNSK